MDEGDLEKAGKEDRHVDSLGDLSLEEGHEAAGPRDPSMKGLRSSGSLSLSRRSMEEPRISLYRTGKG